jgi:HAD superfamily hydrolase (TIGR01509 family)
LRRRRAPGCAADHRARRGPRGSSRRQAIRPRRVQRFDAREERGISRTAILDIDGTLVDTNYQHAIAWYRAFAAHDVVLPVWRIHRHVGMGGDQLIAALAGDHVEEEKGDAIRASEGEIYMDMIEEVRPLDGARELIEDLKELGHAVVLASSAKEEEVEHYLDLLDVRELADAWTTSADVEASKPHPDLVVAALGRGGGGPAAMLGDTPWDCKAAERAGVPTVALMTGGFGEDELREANAVAVFESLGELRARIGETPFGAR